MQLEVRNSDGKRRIAPVPVGAGAIRTSPLKKAVANGVRASPSPAKRKAQGGDHGAQGSKKSKHQQGQGHHGLVQREAHHGDRLAVLPSTSTAAIVFPKPAHRPRFSVRCCECSRLARSSR